MCLHIFCFETNQNFFAKKSNHKLIILRWRITRIRVTSDTKNSKKNLRNYPEIFFWCFGDVLSSRTVASQVFSAIGSLTSVFGMRTGEPSLHCHQTRLMIFKNHHNCIITFVVYFSAFAFISTNEELIL